MTAPWGPWRRYRWPTAGAVAGAAVIGLALAFLVDSGSAGPRPLTGLWEPPPLPVTVSYASPRCRYGPGPDPQVSACSGWRLAVRSGESVEGAEPVEGNGALRSIEIPDAAQQLRVPGGPVLRPPLRVSGDGRRVAYFSTTEQHFVAHDLPSGRRVGLSPRLLDGITARERIGLHVSADGRFFAATRLGRSPQVHLTDFTTGTTTALDGVCEVVGLGRDARRIIGVPCSGDPSEVEDPSELYDRTTWAVFDRRGEQIGTVSERVRGSGVNSALVAADGKHSVGLYREAFGGEYGPDYQERSSERHDVLAVRDLRSGEVVDLVRLPEIDHGWSHRGMVGDRALVSKVSDDDFHLVDLSTGAISPVTDQPAWSDPMTVFGAPATGPATGPPVPPEHPLPTAPPSGVVSGCRGSPCGRWHLVTAAVPEPPMPGALAVPSLFAVSRDGRRLAYGREKDMRLVVHDLKTGKAIPASGPLDPDIGWESDQPRLFFTPDGRRLVYQSGEGQPVEITDTRTGRRSRSRVGPGDGLIGWTSTGPVVHRVTAGEDGPYESELRFLTPGGKRLRTIRTDGWPGGPPSGVSPDGRRGVAPSGEEAPLIIDVATGREVRTDITRYGGRRHWIFQGWVTSDEILVRTEGTATREYGVLTLSTGELDILR
ncbi:hypothetical protein Ppa06_10840 [Planomonospora parontospora subsp. parontospora]|uniref:Uncharacterized protein n=2 Tax=Planomonospora parontospora TaxID=58119 RepID=A0AA37BDL1_9ACTN|nr:hypothetical protein [Planomonospora parontospora]GGK56157.1 hypothetical protein GCM10010126_14730 [Planomonospora parontospora]GII07286.1 hypothetical protein Ppa06_10840 [Planomonospora parontospora subsp. parontospora]